MVSEQNDSNQEIVPVQPEAPKSMVAWDSRGPNPQTVEETFRVARVFHAAGICKNSLKTVEQYMIVIWAGQAIGVPPVQAVQGILLVNDRPAIWGDLGVALVHRSGLMEKFEESFEGDGDDLEAVCVMQRRGGQPKTQRFSMAQAKQAGLTGKDTYRKFDRRMLMWRARYFLIRDLFADVLGGLDIKEIAFEPFDPERMKAAEQPTGVAQRLLDAAPVQTEPMDLRAAPNSQPIHVARGMEEISKIPPGSTVHQIDMAIDGKIKGVRHSDPERRYEPVEAKSATAAPKAGGEGSTAQPPPPAGVPGELGVEVSKQLLALLQAAKGAGRRAGASLNNGQALELVNVARARYGDHERTLLELMEGDWTQAVDRIAGVARVGGAS